MVDVKMVAGVALAVFSCTRCLSTGICYASSSAEIESLIASGGCNDILMRDVNETTMRFVNDNPNVSVYIDIDYNPQVRRVEADGRGQVDTSRIDEVVRTHTSCRGSAGGARLLDITIGSDGSGSPGVCNFSAEPGASVRLAAEPGVVVGFIHATSREWSTVTLEVDERARPTGTLSVGVPPLEILQKFGSQMNDVRMNSPSNEELNAYFAWLDRERYDGTVHVNSGDAEQTPVQVYPPVSE